MKKYKHTAVYKDESRLFYVAIFSCVTVFSLYMYFVSSSIVDVVMRKQVDRELLTLGTTVGRLESEYIEMQHMVSSNIASQRGFVTADKKIFIDKTEETLVLSRN